MAIGIFVTPSRVCELKFTTSLLACKNVNVTPSRVCELKFIVPRYWAKFTKSHTLTGVWVEMWDLTYTAIPVTSHPHGCVSWNFGDSSSTMCRKVTPSRVCELKFFISVHFQFISLVTPSRVCELKYNYANRRVCKCVTPSRVCELK